MVACREMVVKFSTSDFLLLRALQCYVARGPTLHFKASEKPFP